MMNTTRQKMIFKTQYDGLQRELEQIKTTMKEEMDRGIIDQDAIRSLDEKLRATKRASQELAARIVSIEDVERSM